mmetsp:Transcript_11736/g.36146  ORF Transcript_11736/g.36146 Transcript_11736/m.36146 type:complete len:80 (-) Transcript_11736:47-286(-)
MRLALPLLFFAHAVAERGPPPPPPVVVMIACSAHYQDFFENFLAWLGKCGVADDVGVVAVAEDAGRPGGGVFEMHCLCA